MSDKDTLFDEEIQQAGDFVFDRRVVRVFPDMINRSVPGYSLIVPMIGLLARRYAQPGSRLYDLGTSLGAVALAMSQSVSAEKTVIIAVDNSPDMVSGLRERLAQSSCPVPVEVLQQDIRETDVHDASVVVLNFTLQFIEPEHRLELLGRIASGMREGGALVLSEKLVFSDPAEQERQTRWHHDFKRAQGYSELEIARKREALENVMKPDTEQAHHQRLRQAGFSEVYRWFQGFSFASFIALK